jgi:HSP20 family protein
MEEKGGPKVVSDLTRLHGQMRRLMDDMLYQLSPRFLLDRRIWSPQMDVLETPEAFMVVTEASGLKKDEINVTVKKNLVYLAGKRVRPDLANAVRYLQMEIEYGSFERSFELPVNVDETRIEAQYKDGLLTVVLPKKMAKKKIIPIEPE